MRKYFNKKFSTSPKVTILFSSGQKMFLKENMKTWLLLIVTIFLFSCGSSETVSGTKSTKKENESYFDNWEKQWSDNWKKGTQQVSQTMDEMRQVMNGENTIEPISPEELKKFLPGRLSGLEAIEKNAQKTEIWGLKVSEAMEIFQPKSAHWKIKLAITDLGSLAGMTSLIRKDWIKNDVNIRSENGYKRTIYYKSYRALESYNRINKLLKFEVIVNNRFLVEVQGGGTYPHKIREAMEQINWDRLDKLFLEDQITARSEKSLD